MLNVIYGVSQISFYAECHYTECHYAECRYVKCHGSRRTTVGNARAFCIETANSHQSVACTIKVL